MTYTYFFRSTLIKQFLFSLMFAASGFAGLSQAAQVFLEDADPTTPTTNNPNMPSITQHEWPRIMMAETQSFAGPPEQFSKYQIIAAQSGIIRAVGKLQETYPELLYFRMLNPYEFAGYNLEDRGEVCPQGNGLPFNETTAATEGCGIYAGHWMYRAGTETGSALSRSATAVEVADSSIFNVGEYAVIYDAPAGSFENAEHVRITAINQNNDRLTIERAYKSSSQNHPLRSIIAPHVQGQSSVDDTRNWVYNLSVESPRDANNLRVIDLLPIWLRNNIRKDFRGEITNANVSGILFDSDRVFMLRSRDADVNNDLVTDHGISPSGINWFGNGMNIFYAKVRDEFPDLIISGGSRDSGGYEDMNGVQNEGFPTNSEFNTPNPVYDRIGSLLAKYTYQSRQRSTGPAHSHVLTKTPSNTYPINTNTTPSDNSNIRFSLGMTMLEDGYFASLNSATFPDIWYEEYAVDVTPGSSNYGNAVPSSPHDESQIRLHTGWLGKPTGLRQRLYDDDDFDPRRSLLQSGTFENSGDLDDWTGDNVTIATVSGGQNVLDGSRALRSSQHIRYDDVLADTSIRGPRTDFVRGRDYTFVFSARATEPREISATAGGHAERFLLGEDWQRFVVTFTAGETGSFRTNFNVGQESTQVWIDSVYIFEGNASVFRRDFDNGIVVVNATPDRRTIPLGGTFQRIRGTQDPFNNGASGNSITLSAFDAAILINPDAAPPSSDTQPPDIRIIAPTTEAASVIIDTRIIVTDDVAINAENVSFRDVNTVEFNDFECVQVNSRLVECDLTITSSGDLRIVARDLGGNRAFDSRTGYDIDSRNGDPSDNRVPDITITSPTKTSVGLITDTRIVIEDDVGILAQAVKLRDVSTAGVSDFNCTQRNTRRVDCSLTIFSSGNLSLLAIDNAGNERFRGADDFTIVEDNQIPNIQITAPTKTSNRAITDTLVTVRDNLGLSASAVVVRPSGTTALVDNLNCSQVSLVLVTCQLSINSSGDILLMATDLTGNVHFRSESGFIINPFSVPAGAIMMLLEE